MSATTTTKRDGASKRWCFTLYAQEFNFDSAIMEYAVVGREICPTTKREHLQGFLSTLKPLRFTALKKILGSSTHIEKAMGSVDDNYRYCTKDGNFTEYGTRPAEPLHLRTRKRDYEGALILAKDGRYEEIEASIICASLSNLIKYQNICLAEKRDLTRPCGLWIVGPPGIGKSYWVRQNFSPLFNKMHNKWWDTYQGEPYVLIDDYDSSSKMNIHAMKLWADEYHFQAETKGASVHIRPRAIIVTSNYHPYDVFGQDPILLAAIERRFKICPVDSRGDIQAIQWLAPDYLQPACKLQRELSITSIATLERAHSTTEEGSCNDGATRNSASIESVHSCVSN